MTERINAEYKKAMEAASKPWYADFGKDFWKGLFDFTTLRNAVAEAYKKHPWIVLWTGFWTIVVLVVCACLQSLMMVGG